MSEQSKEAKTVSVKIDADTDELSTKLDILSEKVNKIKSQLLEVKELICSLTND